MKNKSTKLYLFSLIAIILVTIVVALVQITNGSIEPILQYVFVFAITVISFGNLTSFLTYTLCNKAEYSAKRWIFAAIYCIINGLLIVGLGVVSFVLHIFS